jgi:hypothetical protein
MLQAEPDAGGAAPQALFASPPGEHRGAPGVVITVLIIAATLAIAAFVALVVVPSAGAAGGCGGG